MSIPARPTHPYPGAPLEPTGDPMKDGVGAASWATDRADRVDLTHDGRPRIQPMSRLEGWSIEAHSPDPRGLQVVAADGKSPGTVTDLWVDLGEPQIRYLEVALADGEGTVLLPMGYARIRGHTSRGLRRGPGDVRVKAILSHHFADVPRPKADDRITLLEEDRVVAWYAGGYRYAEPSRNEPLI